MLGSHRTLTQTSHSRSVPHQQRTIPMVHQSSTTTFHPQTPRSPCRFSPATSSLEVMATFTSGSQPTVAALPTPAHSVNGANSQSDTVMVDDSPHKRKRLLEDVGGDRDPKKMHVEDHRLGIDNLHLDVGKKHLLCQSRPTSSASLASRTSEDLFALYGLADLAAEVAREKPNGEKNALRKTYKGHIKRLGVAGHFDVQKKKEDAPSDLMAMIQVPDLEWNVHQVKGREISDGLSDATLSNLSRALTMSKGPLPKAVWDSSVLGDLAPANPDTSKSASSKNNAPDTPSASSPNAMGRSKSQLSHDHDPTRPRRSAKKRSYGDSSFEGYGEGFPDDDAGVDTGYSTGEGEGRQKRRKRNSPGNSPPYPTMHQQSYGPGMVGA